MPVIKALRFILTLTDNEGVEWAIVEPPKAQVSGKHWLLGPSTDGSWSGRGELLGKPKGDSKWQIEDSKGKSSSDVNRKRESPTASTFDNMGPSLRERIPNPLEAC